MAVRYICARKQVWENIRQNLRLSSCDAQLTLIMKLLISSTLPPSSQDNYHTMQVVHNDQLFEIVLIDAE
jgi:hypothetical protein